jgi:hypothetical protein
VERYLVCISDRRTDLLVGHESTADVWCYEIDAEDAHAAVEPAMERWRDDAGPRTAVSLTVSQMRPAQPR